MNRFVRVAGYAAAVFGIAASPTFANPSMGWGSDGAETATYAQHADAIVDQVAPEANLIPAQGSYDPNLTEAIARHAVAPVAPEAAADGMRALSALVDDYANSDTDNSEMECLAGAIYFESKGEPLAGQLAVAEVIINRTTSGRYPKSLCGVVKQPSQFSFVRGGRIPSIPKDSPHWRKAVAIAHIAMQDLADSPASEATAFHAAYVSPRWKMKRVARVGNHIFYR